MSMLTMDGHLIDGYLDYRALSVDLRRARARRSTNIVLMQGPVMGATLHF